MTPPQAPVLPLDAQHGAQGIPRFIAFLGRRDEALKIGDWKQVLVGVFVSAGHDRLLTDWNLSSIYARRIDTQAASRRHPLPSETKKTMTL